MMKNTGVITANATVFILSFAFCPLEFSFKVLDSNMPKINTGNIACPPPHDAKKH